MSECPNCHGAGLTQKHHDNWFAAYRATSVTFCRCVRGQRKLLEFQQSSLAKSERPK